MQRDATLKLKETNSLVSKIKLYPYLYLLDLCKLLLMSSFELGMMMPKMILKTP